MINIYSSFVLSNLKCKCSCFRYVSYFETVDFKNGSIKNIIYTACIYYMYITYVLVNINLTMFNKIKDVFNEYT